MLGTALLAVVVLSEETPERAVLAAQRQWIDGYNHRDEKALGAIEADDFRITFSDGSMQTKADQLIRLRAAPPAGAEYEIVVASSEIHLYKNAAVVTGVIAERGKVPDGQGAIREFNQRSRYTDTWILQHGRWRVVASHLSDLR
jgi:hypothetical protein